VILCVYKKILLKLLVVVATTTTTRFSCCQTREKKAAETIPPLVEEYAISMGVSPSGIRIGSAKKSWGSCTAKGLLTFSWRLMMAPPGAIEYVVVHELSHLKQLNHSKAFWAVVEGVMPDWKDRRKELRLLQKRILI